MSKQKQSAAISAEEFAKQLQRQLGRQRPRIRKTVLLKDYGKELVLEALTEEEMMGIIHTHETDEAVARAIAYQGCPDLREAAGQLLELNAIKQPMEVLHGLRPADIAALSKMIVELSAEYNQPGIEEVQDIKNS